MHCRSKKQGAYGKVPVIKAGTLTQLAHIDEVTPGATLRAECRTGALYGFVLLQAVASVVFP